LRSGEIAQFYLIRCAQDKPLTTLTSTGFPGLTNNVGSNGLEIADTKAPDRAAVPQSRDSATIRNCPD